MACFLLVLAALHAPATAQTTGDWRFGVVESYTAPNSARELGTAWTRVRFQWADAQAEDPIRGRQRSQMSCWSRSWLQVAWW